MVKNNRKHAKTATSFTKVRIWSKTHDFTLEWSKNAWISEKRAVSSKKQPKTTKNNGNHENCGKTIGFKENQQKHGKIMRCDENHCFLRKTAFWMHFCAQGVSRSFPARLGRFPLVSRSFPARVPLVWGVNAQTPSARL